MPKFRWILPLALLFSSVAAVSADAIAVPNRLEKARKGEWVAYTAMGGVTEKQTIVNVEEKDGDRLFTIGSELIIDDEVVQSGEMVISLSDAVKESQSLFTGDQAAKVTRERETLLDKEIDVVVVETVEEGETYRTVLSDAVPVSGIVRIEANGIPVVEVTAFGEE